MHICGTVEYRWRRGAAIVTPEEVLIKGNCAGRFVVFCTFIKRNHNGSSTLETITHSSVLFEQVLIHHTVKKFLALYKVVQI